MTVEDGEITGSSDVIQELIIITIIISMAISNVT